MVCAVLVVVPLTNIQTAHGQTVTLSPITEIVSLKYPNGPRGLFSESCGLGILWRRAGCEGWSDSSP